MKIIKNVEVLRKNNECIMYFGKTDPWEMPLVYMAVYLGEECSKFVLQLPLWYCKVMNCQIPSLCIDNRIQLRILEMESSFAFFPLYIILLQLVSQTLTDEEI